MRTMTWEEIEKDWNGLQKRHRMEIAQAIVRYCVGHRMLASRVLDLLSSELSDDSVGESESVEHSKAE